MSLRPFVTLAALERALVGPKVTIRKTASVGKSEQLLHDVRLTLPPMAHQRPRPKTQPMGQP